MRKTIVVVFALLVAVTAMAENGNRSAGAIKLTTPADQSTVVDIRSHWVDFPLSSISFWTVGNGATPLSVILSYRYRPGRASVSAVAYRDTFEVIEGESYNLDASPDSVSLGAGAPACDLKIVFTGGKDR